MNAIQVYLFLTNLNEKYCKKCGVSEKYSCYSPLSTDLMKYLTDMKYLTEESKENVEKAYFNCYSRHLK